MALTSRESILLEEGASHFHNFIAVGGNLKLTKTSIIFSSCASAKYQHEICIQLNQIANIEFSKTMFMNPNGLTLMLKDGQLENFIVDDRKGWKEKILSVVSQFA